MRGNAACDALRHDFKAGRRASGDAFPRRAWERALIRTFLQNAVSRRPPRWIKVTPPALALLERLRSPFPGTVIDGTS
ncbi:DUF1534 domain-containing protein [Pseudomonas frederiksbergensis]|nr:DUF1534 domain-containing protein [Pseudomonas frederiksbergensis]